MSYRHRRHLYQEDEDVYSLTDIGPIDADVVGDGSDLDGSGSGRGAEAQTWD